jgi:glucose/arabinose dehydrogenase
VNHKGFLLLLVVSASGLSLLVAVVSAVRQRLRRKNADWPKLMLLSVLFVSAVCAACISEPTQNFVRDRVGSLKSFKIDAWLAVAGGAGLAGMWSALWDSSLSPLRRWLAAGGLVLGFLAVVAAVVPSPLSSPSIAPPDSSAGSFTQAVPEGFTIEPFCSLDFYPIRVATSKNRLFVCGIAERWQSSGVVARIEAVGSAPAASTIIARDLNRPCGLAFHEEDLYVSRSGQWTQAKDGALSRVSTGAVTLLRDLDGDGIIDYYSDVISGLPGQKEPWPMHQNCGLAIGSDGKIYIGSGSHSNRSPSVDPMEGAILRANLDGSGLEVFARGFRQPFGLTFGPFGKLYANDNDPGGMALGGTAAGDELNLVEEGGHYGHPFAHGESEPPKGCERPLWVCRDSPIQGVAWCCSDRWPAPYQDCLFVAATNANQILRIEVREEGGRFTARSEPFATVESPLDLTFSEDGTLYVSSFALRTIHRITPPAAGSPDDPPVAAALP